MSVSGLIIEGLHSKRVCESFYEDTPVCYKSRELQKVCSDTLEKKYLSIFKPLGAEDIGVEVYVHDDEKSMVEEAIYEVTVYIAFDDKAKIDVKAVEKLINTHMRNYPKFVFDKPSKQFYSTSDSYDDIIDILYVLEKDGCNIKKLYSIKDASDIEDAVDAQMREWEEERKDQERDYWRSRL